MTITTCRHEGFAAAVRAVSRTPINPGYPTREAAEAQAKSAQAELIRDGFKNAYAYEHGPYTGMGGKLIFMVSVHNGQGTSWSA